jgi:hypothetical protein
LDPDKDNLLTLGICSRNLGALTIGGSAAAIVPRPAQYGWSYRPHLITPPAPKCISDAASFSRRSRTHVRWLLD